MLPEYYGLLLFMANFSNLRDFTGVVKRPSGRGWGLREQAGVNKKPDIHPKRDRISGGTTLINTY